jgi:hypothetical protein
MTDFLTELRGELLDAHASRRRKGRGQRAVGTFRSGVPRGLAVAAVAGALVAAALVFRVMLPPPSGAPRVVDVIRLGGNPTDAVLADGSVWVSDFAGRRVIRLEPGNRRVVARIAVSGQPVALAAGAGQTWVRAAVGDRGVVTRVGSDRSARVGFGATLAAGQDAVWAADVELGPERLQRIDAGTGRLSGRVGMRGVYALASGGDALWAVAAGGTVVQLDARSGAVRARWPAIAISSGSAVPAIAADADGAWVLRVGQGADSQAIRLEGNRITRHLPIPSSARPLLAEAPDGLWSVDEDVIHHRSSAIRLDPETGSVTARVDLGSRNPTALLPVGREIWIAASDGTVSVVGA